MQGHVQALAGAEKELGVVVRLVDDLHRVPGVRHGADNCFGQGTVSDVPDAIGRRKAVKKLLGEPFGPAAPRQVECPVAVDGDFDPCELPFVR